MEKEANNNGCEEILNITLPPGGEIEDKFCENEKPVCRRQRSRDLIEAQQGSDEWVLITITALGGQTIPYLSIDEWVSTDHYYSTLWANHSLSQYRYSVTTKTEDFVWWEMSEGKKNCKRFSM